MILKESADEHIKHLSHVEDDVFAGNFERAHQTLSNLHEHLKGKKSDIESISTKTDGSVAVVFGHHPITKQFFVGSKSAFNKDAKINYTNEDIDKNHGHSPGLAETLKHALKHLPKIAGKSGVYQSDIVFAAGTKNDKTHHNDGSVSFTPNTISYHIHRAHPDVQDIKNAKIGLSVHTKYEGEPEHSGTLSGMKAKPFFGRESLDSHKDVHVTDNRFKKPGPMNHIEIEHQLKTAAKIHSTLSDIDISNVSQHEGTLNSYINKTIKDDESPGVPGYVQHIHDRLTKDIDKVKTDKAKERKMQIRDDAKQHVIDNYQAFHKTLLIHGHLQKAKDSIIQGMNSSNHYYSQQYRGQKVNPEGYAIVRNSRTSKLVNRKEFSKNNFENGQIRFAKKV